MICKHNQLCILRQSTHNCHYVISMVLESLFLYSYVVLR